MVTVEIGYAAPHHLTADGPVLGLRRTPAGDAWAARTGAAPGSSTAVSLGMPTIGPPATTPATGAGPRVETAAPPTRSGCSVRG
jgi:tRNA-2-methylthio-N6-dimethylallyladenosine synthase